MTEYLAEATQRRVCFGVCFLKFYHCDEGSLSGFIPSCEWSRGLSHVGIQEADTTGHSRHVTHTTCKQNAHALMWILVVFFRNKDTCLHKHNMQIIKPQEISICFISETHYLLDLQFFQDFFAFFLSLLPARFFSFLKHHLPSPSHLACPC